MKIIIIFSVALLVCTALFGQIEYYNSLPKPPAVMKHENVTAYIKAVDSIQSIVNKKITEYKAENEAAVKNIDKSKIAQQYANYGQPGNVDMSIVQKMQTAQQVALADQKRLDDLIAGFKKTKDSIDAVYKIDYEVFYKDYIDWVNTCGGAVEKNQETACDNMLGNLNGSRTGLLEKYFFGAGLYAQYINSYTATVGPVYIEAAKSMADYSELTLMGNTVPHKEDLAYCELVDDLVIMIHDAYNIYPGLWPLEDEGNK